MSRPSLQTEEQRIEKPVSTLFGKVAADILCYKHLLSGVKVRISFVRPKPGLALIYYCDAKKYNIILSHVNLYVRETTVSDKVLTAIGKTLLTKTPALYHYTEILPKTYLISQEVEVGAKSMYSARNQ